MPDAVFVPNAPADEGLFVTVAKFGSNIAQVPFVEGMTVGQALDEAKLEVPEGYAIKIGSADASRDQVLLRGEKILVVGDVQGG